MWDAVVQCRLWGGEILHAQGVLPRVDADEHASG